MTNKRRLDVTAERSRAALWLNALSPLLLAVTNDLASTRKGKTPKGTPKIMNKVSPGLAIETSYNPDPMNSNWSRSYVNIRYDGGTRAIS